MFYKLIRLLEKEIRKGNKKLNPMLNFFLGDK